MIRGGRVSSSVLLVHPDGSDRFEVQADQTLLDAAIDAGIPLEHSCRRGQCLKCRANLPGGEEILLCQQKADGISEIHLSDNPHAPFPAARLLPVKIKDMTWLTADICGLTLVLPRNQTLDWRPGQYAEIRVNAGLARHYSIAGADIAERTVTFHIRALPGGAFGGWLRDQARVGDLLQMVAPLGRFGWRPEAASHTLLFATGTGIVPFFAMLNRMSDAERQRAGRIDLFWGNRTRADAYLEDDLRQLARNFDLSVEMCYSRELDHRHVTDVASEVIDANAHVYSAGHPQMVADIRGIALGKSVPSGRIAVDAFVLTQ